MGGTRRGPRDVGLREWDCAGRFSRTFYFRPRRDPLALARNLRRACDPESRGGHSGPQVAASGQELCCGRTLATGSGACQGAFAKSSIVGQFWDGGGRVVHPCWLLYLRKLLSCSRAVSPEFGRTGEHFFRVSARSCDHTASWILS